MGGEPKTTPEEPVAFWRELWPKLRTPTPRTPEEEEAAWARLRTPLGVAAHETPQVSDKRSSVDLSATAHNDWVDRLLDDIDFLPLRDFIARLKEPDDEATPHV